MATGREFITVQRGLEIPFSEVRFTFSRSGGPGGQHVNKVETVVTLTFDVPGSPTLTPSQKNRILSRLGNRIDRNGLLQLSENRERSQYRNRELVVERFVTVLRTALKVEKRRVKTRPPKSANRSRLDEKKKQATKKSNRRKPSPDAD